MVTLMEQKQTSLWGNGSVAQESTWFSSTSKILMLVSEETRFPKNMKTTTLQLHLETPTRIIWAQMVKTFLSACSLFLSLYPPQLEVDCQDITWKWKRCAQFKEPFWWNGKANKMFWSNSEEKKGTNLPGSGLSAAGQEGCVHLEGDLKIRAMWMLGVFAQLDKTCKSARSTILLSLTIGEVWDVFLIQILGEIFM